MKERIRLSRTTIATLSALAALGALGSSAAQGASGNFTFVTGEVSLTRANGQRVAALRGTEVNPGDSIVTGANGMAQLAMIDQARLSLRPNSQFRIEGYQRTAESTEGAVLNLLRGTLRTFTGLIAATNREKFVMKTRVATVGIRGSGNILYACSTTQNDCDASITGLGTGGAGGDFTVNHTIEGSHAVSNQGDSLPPGMPPQQGGPQTLITGPGQTVMVQGNQPPKYIPTPQFISDSATNPTGQAKGAAPPPVGEAAADARTYAPGDNQQIPGGQQNTGTPVGNNGLGFVIVDASSNLLSDPASLHDIVIATSGPFLGQAAQGDVTLEGTALRGYNSYPGSLSGLRPVIEGGTLRETLVVPLGTGQSITLGRYENATLGFSGTGSGFPVLGNIHWIYAPSGYPTYLSDVLTGTATYTLVAATSPTNQNNTPGTLGSATLNVNFTNRTLGLALGISIPAAGGNSGGSWNATATNVPFALNTFFATTADRLVVINGTGQTSATNALLSGAIEGSFVGSSLQGAILGYGITDQTNTNAVNHNVVTGVAGFTGPAQNGAAPFREGRVTDPAGFLATSDFSRNYSTTNRPDEVTSDTDGRVTTFVAPAAGLGSRAVYALGSAQVVQSGFDPETGMVWGRWGNGLATFTGNGSSQSLNLNGSSLHYIFAGTQQGPTTLPLTGTASYDVIGNTNPTDGSGNVGTLGSATLDANFTNRTASSTVNVAIAGQNWIGTAPNMPIYRDMYFSASTGSSIPGVQNLSPLAISCTPNCGQGATGSFDGFFTGRTGSRAGMTYNMGGVQGAIAFGRRGG
jgi:hypothetical protein